MTGTRSTSAFSMRTGASAHPARVRAWRREVPRYSAEIGSTSAVEWIRCSPLSRSAPLSPGPESSSRSPSLASSEHEFQFRPGSVHRRQAGQELWSAGDQPDRASARVMDKHFSVIFVQAPPPDSFPQPTPACISFRLEF